MQTALYAAGLGDVIRVIYLRGGYRHLCAATEPTPVLVASHNPFTIEIFRYHRNARNFILYDLGHKYEEFRLAGLKGGEITKALFDFAGLPLESMIRGDAEGHVPVFDAPDDVPSHGHVVFCPFAGGGARTFTPAFIEKVVGLLRRLPVPVYLVTRSFPIRTKGRLIHDEENARRFEGGNIHVMDHLSVPASINLVRNSCAFVGSWSSMQQAAWFENKPVAVFYPTNWCDVVNRTGYAFGIDRPDCFHSDFASADMERFKYWLAQWACKRPRPVPTSAPASS